MQASSLTRRFLTISFNVAIIAGRFSLVSSDVSIKMPSDTASEGAAITLGRFAGTLGAAAVSAEGGSCSVSSNPIDAFFFPEDFSRLDASVVSVGFSVRLAGLTLLAATEEFSVERGLGARDATVLEEGLPTSGLGGASNAAALA